MTMLSTITPRKDVLAGALIDSRFTAGLEDVAVGTAANTYRKPEKFFAQTYPSEGLKTLLNEALGRVGGTRPDAASVFRLESSFGGGKTHNLIALFHAAGAGIPADLIPSFMDPAVLAGVVSRPPVVVTFVGTSARVTAFPFVDGIAARTPWGYLALQIGGPAAYEVVRKDDKDLSAPGSDQLKRVFGSKPVLILIDEFARYLSAAETHRVGDGTLAKQTLAFLMALLAAADSSERVAVVITTAGEADAFADGTEALANALKGRSGLLAHKELVLRPSAEADLPKILGRRLFETDMTDLPEKKAVALRYAQAAEVARSAGLDLPPEKVSGNYAKDIEASYPFHPDLVTVLDKRLSTIPYFQGTRGALRLLARAVRRVWEKEEDLDLIHLHHVDLSEAALAEDLSSRINRPLYEPVIRADVAEQPGGAPSHADEVDARMGTPYGRRLATAAYLFGLTTDVPDVAASDLYGAILTPGDDPKLIVKALQGLEHNCWYLHADVHGYRFSPAARSQAPESGPAGRAMETRPGRNPRRGEDTLLHPPGSFVGPGSEPKAAGTEFISSGAAGPAFINACKAAAEAGRTHVERMWIDVAVLGEGADKELQRLLTVAAGAGATASRVYDITAHVRLDHPEHEVSIVFKGTADEYTPLAEALGTLLRRSADFKAAVDVTWPGPIELEGAELAGVIAAAQATGPTKCDVRLVVDGQRTP